MIKRDVLKDLIKNYYPEGSNDQINAMVEEVSREAEVITHSKTVSASALKESIGRLHD